MKIIGWDVKDGQPCWLIENSWGPEWGMEGIGYLLIHLDAYRSIRLNYKWSGSPSRLPLRTMRASHRIRMRWRRILIQNNNR